MFKEQGTNLFVENNGRTVSQINDGHAHQYLHEFSPSIPQKEEAHRVYRLVDQLYCSVKDAENPAEGTMARLVNSVLLDTLSQKFSLVRKLVGKIGDGLRYSNRFQSDYCEQFPREGEPICSISTIDGQPLQWLLTVEYQPQTPGRVVIKVPELKIEQIQEVLNSSQ